jgi:hypothetical protein
MSASLKAIAWRVAIDLVGRARHADREGALRHAAAPEQRREAARVRRQRVVGGDAHAVERELGRRQRLDAHVALGRGREPLRLARHHEETGAVVGLRRDQHLFAAVEPRHQALAALEHEARAVAPRARRRTQRVGAVVRLDERQRAGAEARAAERRQPALALGVAAEVGDREGLERGRQDRRGDGEVAPGELLGHQHGGQRAARAAAAEALVDAARHQAERVRLLQQLGGQLRGLVAVARARSQLVAREAAHRLDDELLLLTGLEVDHAGPRWRVPPVGGAG